MTRQISAVLPPIFLSLFLLVLQPQQAFAFQAVVSWDPNHPSPEGYKVYMRTTGQAYRFNSPIWTNSATTSTIRNLLDNTRYYFVVTAYEGAEEGLQSEEVWIMNDTLAGVVRTNAHPNGQGPAPTPPSGPPPSEPESPEEPGGQDLLPGMKPGDLPSAPTAANGIQLAKVPVLFPANSEGSVLVEWQTTNHSWISAAFRPEGETQWEQTQWVLSGKTHAVSLTGLSPQKTYEIELIAKDQNETIVRHRLTGIRPLNSHQSSISFESLIDEDDYIFVNEVHRISVPFKYSVVPSSGDVLDFIRWDWNGDGQFEVEEASRDTFNPRVYEYNTPGTYRPKARWVGATKLFVDLEFQPALMVTDLEGRKVVWTSLDVVRKNDVYEVSGFVQVDTSQGNPSEQVNLKYRIDIDGDGEFEYERATLPAEIPYHKGLGPSPTMHIQVVGEFTQSLLTVTDTLATNAYETADSGHGLAGSSGAGGGGCFIGNTYEGGSFPVDLPGRVKTVRQSLEKTKQWASKMFQRIYLQMHQYFVGEKKASQRSKAH